MNKQIATNNILAKLQSELEIGLDLFADADKLELVYAWLRDYKVRLVARLDLLPEVLTDDMLELVNDIARNEQQ